MSNRGLGYRQKLKIKPEDWEELKRLVENTKIVRRQTVEEVEAARGVKLWGYVRCSHQDSIDSGLGIEAQCRLISRWAEFIREQYPQLPDVEWLEEDKAVSAFKVQLKLRPAGKILHQSLRAGDHIVFAYLDRTWRNTEDCLSTLRLWTERGVTVHIANLHVNTKTWQGKMLLTVIAACAEMESGMKSERVKEVFAGFKAKGRLANGHAPMGFKLVGKNGVNRVAVPDPETRRIMGEIVQVRDLYKWTWPEISDYIEKLLSEQLGRDYTQPWKKRKWSYQRCSRAYDAELKLRAKASKKEEQ